MKMFLRMLLISTGVGDEKRTTFTGITTGEKRKKVEEYSCQERNCCVQAIQVVCFVSEAGINGR
ncbi:hypothetical protein ACE175_23090 [Escherichia albertii]|uniref:hypothetical protein n=1 Tax=Escherichia albertii TaxID=208962 RepID=UPI00190BC7E0|nr:hypothetical protein [Escherichia albertii]MCV3221929.1 hypothetical protein [Escherichia albertii]MCV3226195.1 hypothetical protein [Escherichia albertii]MCV3237927.1 hypothetical protein [Escherichia albertii]MCV3248472.1 hypothetical protein [Escherichia albertii]MCV3262034.1 hypothetical protein [Escherichia albertii]